MTLRRNTAGNGPLCPVNNQHGRLYSWEGGRWYCPSHPHGGNGKFFSEKEAYGDYAITEEEVTALLESTARDIIAERTSLEQAVTTVARQTKRSSATVRESLTLMVKTIQEHGNGVNMADKRSAARAAKAAAPKATSSKTLEHVEASEFVRVLNELGLTNKQAAEATGAAGMGASATYIYILLHKGASAQLFAKYEAALRAYAADLPEEAEEAEPETAEPVGA